MDKELESMKKVRLVEEQISYEELALMDNFSEDELTCELQRRILKEKKERMWASNTWQFALIHLHAVTCSHHAPSYEPRLTCVP